MPIRVRSAKTFATKVIGLGGGAHTARAKLADVADWRALDRRLEGFFLRAAGRLRESTFLNIVFS